MLKWNLVCFQSSSSEAWMSEATDTAISACELTFLPFSADDSDQFQLQHSFYFESIILSGWFGRSVAGRQLKFAQMHSYQSASIFAFLPKWSFILYFIFLSPRLNIECIRIRICIKYCSLFIYRTCAFVKNAKSKQKEYLRSVKMFQLFFPAFLVTEAACIFPQTIETLHSNEIEVFGGKCSNALVSGTEKRWK